jgi:hypothetical protein
MIGERTSVKNDEGKLRYDLLPWDAIEEVVKVLDYGIKKYPNPNENWRKNSTKEDIKRFEAAMLRHYSAMKQGKMLDDESGLPHISHVATNVLFIIALQKDLSDDEG